MDKVYDPKTIEPQWGSQWEDKGHYQPSQQGSPYSIMLPPPNVTGTLHMGHGFQHTLMDVLIRLHRMQGCDTLWQGGTDHAGIATQMVVERQLAQDGLSRHDLGRETFIDRVWQWRKQSGSVITQQIRRLGASIDWSRERFTMDPQLSHATQEAFIRLYEDGLIYRGQRLVNWDIKFGTAISDLEVVNEEQAGSLWHIHYPLADQSGHLTIATTRPETLLGDTAVAVHPDDERYQHLIGQMIQLPLCDRQIPIIADDYVDPKFGTGCVKITPAHDFNDYAVGKRHDLPMLSILDFEGQVNHHAPAAYQGMERFAARKQIVKDLTAQGLLEKTEAHTINVPRGDRSGVIIEPMLTYQWFVNAKPLADKAIAALKQGDFCFTPANWANTYLQWLENIQDWCISRQLWWGHRIPVWYDEQDKQYVGYDEADVRQRHQLDAHVTLRQDEDVLDTWFSSGLWPFATLGWPEKTAELDTYFPTSVLITGFDIIFFWVARMVMMSLYFTGKVPFKTVYITGLIRDNHGKKMSKSKGNVLDPIDMVDGIDLESLIAKRTQGLMQPQMQEKITKLTRQDFPDGINAYGTDALRFTFCALANTGRDINFDMGRIEGYRNFCNKIWNATRFVLMNVENQTIKAGDQPDVIDQWINSRLQATLERTLKAFAQFRFDRAAQAIYEFIWSEYCDWYLELAKCKMNQPNADEANLAQTRYTLLHVLETTMRLIHPLMPFISEEIWQRIAPMIARDGETIMTQSYPQYDEQHCNSESEQDIDWLQKLITNIRNIRSEMNVSPAKKIQVIFNKGDSKDRQRTDDLASYIQALAKIEHISWAEPQQALPASATAILGALEIHIPLAGLIDKEAEIDRLKRQIDKLTKEYTKSHGKLNNPSYVDKAPEAVVNKERDRLAETESALDKLKAHYQRIEML